jgi:hypothetical protein
MSANVTDRPHFIAEVTMTDRPNPDTRLSRRDTAAALTASGYPISAATLSTLASRGGGPEYTLFNGRALYRLGDALAWAEARMSAPRRTAAEGRQAA